MAVKYNWNGQISLVRRQLTNSSITYLVTFMNCLPMAKIDNNFILRKHEYSNTSYYKPFDVEFENIWQIYN